MPKHPDEICESFCQNYVQTLDTKSAYEATYSVFDTGMLMDAKAVSRRASNMMRRKGVKQRISELLAQRSMATEERVRTEIENIAFSKITDVVEFGETEDVDDEGNIVKEQFLRLKDSNEIPAAAARAIKAVKQTANGITIEMHDKLNALTTLAQTHAGLQKVSADEKAGAETPTLILFNSDEGMPTEHIEDLRKREDYVDAVDVDEVDDGG